MIYILVFIQQVLASGTHVIAKDLTNTIQAPFLLLLRSFIAALFCIIWAVFSRKKLLRIEKKDYLVLILLGIVNIPVNQFLFLTSIHLSTAPNIALAYALTPAFVLVIAIIFLKESSTFKKILGVVIAIIGTIAVLFEHGFSFSSQYMAGNLLGLVASLSWALYTILSRDFSRKYGGFYTMALSMVLGFIFYLPVYAFTNSPMQFSNISFNDWIEILYLGLIASVVAYAIWNYALTKKEASKISVFNNLQPIFTTILAIIFFGFHLTIPFIIGGVLILIGVFITQKG